MLMGYSWLTLHLLAFMVVSTVVYTLVIRGAALTIK
jgi:hypothetical protein